MKGVARAGRGTAEFIMKESRATSLVSQYMYGSTLCIMFVIGKINHSIVTEHNRCLCRKVPFHK